MSIKYIQFRHDVVISAGGDIRNFNAWMPDKHGDHVQPEELANGDVLLHAVKTENVYDKGVTTKKQTRTGKTWKVKASGVAWIMNEEAPKAADVKAKA